MSITLTGVTVRRPVATAGSPPTNDNILHDISCDFADGTLTVLVGRTGSGKSTLLDVLGGLRQPTTGTRRIDGRQIVASDLRIGTVFQFPDHLLFARTVRAELTYSLRGSRLSPVELERRIHAVLDDMALPPALLDASPLRLSGGQKRRLAIATILITQPDWLLMDEPTSGLDPAITEHLMRIVQRWRGRTRGGVIVATHDLDAFFPVADDVVVLQRGRIIQQATPQSLSAQPQSLLVADVGLPSAIAIRVQLAAAGITIPTDPLSAAEMATAIRGALATTQHISPPPTELALTLPEPDGVPAEHPDDDSHPTQSTWLQSLDPRAKWLTYLLISTGILLQRTGLGLLIATGLVMLLVGGARVPVQRLWPIVKSLGMLLVVSTVLAGIHFGHIAGMWHVGAVGLSLPAMATTAGRLWQLVLVGILGVVLTVTTSHLQMKRGLERMLSPLAKFRVPAEAIALAGALMLRFIPVLMDELQRFARIAQARGQQRTGRSRRLRARDLPTLLIPLLVSVFHLGEALSMAMEARGYHRLGLKRTSYVTLRMTNRDTVSIAAGTILCLALIALARWSA